VRGEGVAQVQGVPIDLGDLVPEKVAVARVDLDDVADHPLPVVDLRGRPKITGVWRGLPEAERALLRIPEEWPQAFLRLRWSEQRWRGRAFLVAYIYAGGDGSGGKIAYAWSVSLDGDPETAVDMKTTIERIPDATIAEGLDSLSR
jgi:hypothetical protein